MNINVTVLSSGGLFKLPKIVEILVCKMVSAYSFELHYLTNFEEESVVYKVNEYREYEKASGRFLVHYEGVYYFIKEETYDD